MAQFVEIDIDQGTDFTLDLALKEDDGTPRNMIGYRFTASIKKSYHSNSVANFTINALQAATGNIILTMDAATTAKIRPGRYLFDVKQKDSLDTVERLVEGIVTVNPQVSVVFNSGTSVGGTGLVDYYPGSQGSQGIAGIQGVQGISGSGTQGVTGTQGFYGIQGPAGSGTGNGSQGIQGISGNQGIQGITGIQGISGYGNSWQVPTLNSTTSTTLTSAQSGDLIYTGTADTTWTLPVFTSTSNGLVYRIYNASAYTLKVQSGDLVNQLIVMPTADAGSTTYSASTALTLGTALIPKFAIPRNGYLEIMSVYVSGGTSFWLVRNNIGGIASIPLA